VRTTIAVAIAAASILSCGSSGTGSGNAGSGGGAGRGTAGVSGSAGATGAAGGGGAAGATGVAGTTGAAGRGGTTGSAGATGAAGTTGAAGATGVAGTTGGAGRGGTTGSAGATGAAGTTGSAGRGGTTGSAGATGAAGTTGAAGRGGATGTAGTGGAGAACPGSLTAGDHNETITSSGMSRTFIVHLPTGYTGATPLPVILDFHPLGGTGSSQKSASGWDKKCDSVGCIALFPDSASNASNGWNVGYCCSGAQQNKIDDVQFTRDMIKWLEANTCVDPKRIYASGCSNGGGMSYMLACKAADVVAAVAPVDFRCITGAAPSNASSLTATNNTACTCTLPRPISVTAFDEGQDNSIVPYNGGQTAVAADCPPGGSCSAFNFPSAQVNFGTWANFDMCTGSAMTNPTNSICQTYMSCSANTEVTLCTAPSGNHCGSYGLAKIVDTAWTQFQKEALP
jgi:polyhydroxybutyrate depolymerase